MKTTMNYAKFDNMLPDDFVRIFVLSDLDSVDIMVFRKNMGESDDSVLGFLYWDKHDGSAELIYSCKVYRKDQSINGWCYTYDAEVEQ